MTARSTLRELFVRSIVWLAFLALGFAAVVHTGLPQGPAGGLFATAQSIVQHRTVTIDGDTAMLGPLDAAALGIAYVNNHYHAPDVPGAAFLAVPAVWLGLPLADGLRQPDAAMFLVGLTGVLVLALAVVALAWAGVRLGLSPLRSLIGAAIGIGAFLYPVGALTDSTVLLGATSLILALTLVDGADSRVEEGWTPHGRLTLTGFVLGCLPLLIWYGWLAAVFVGIALIIQGGRTWWTRVPWLALGMAGPVAALALYNTVWFGRPWREAWLYTIGDGWQRTIEGRFIATPFTVLRQSARALLDLSIRHPLLIVGFVACVVGMAFVPWRARAVFITLALTLGLPSLIERQPDGLAAEMRPLLLWGAFAAVGSLLLLALVARERPGLVRAVIPVGLALIAAGVVASIIGGDGERTIIITAGSHPSSYIAPLTLLGGALILLLLVPMLQRPRVRRERATLLTAAMLLLLTVLSGCGSAASVGTDARSDAPNLLPALAMRGSGGITTAVWTLDANAQIAPDGATLTAPKGAGTATSPRVPVQAGDAYQVRAHVIGQRGAPNGVTGRVQWFDREQHALGESVLPLPVGLPSADAAAPVGATTARVAVSVPVGVTIDDIQLRPRDGGRLDPLPAYAKAALAFSFDYETAMGGLIHTRGGETAHDVNDAEARGLAMRNGAVFLRRLFAAYDTRATFYVNGYNFLTGNTERRVFVGNPTYTRYTQRNGWASDYWTTHPWYGDDPYGTEQTNPAWYFGSLTKQLAQDGHDIESHTFGHLFIHAGITAKELDDDLTEWDTVAKENGYAPAHSFAFPWVASNSVTPEYYAVLAKHGITNVTRFYDLKPGTYELFSVPDYPAIHVIPDQELIDRQGDEQAAMRGIEMTLATGGVFSLWAHPESITSANAQAIWGRVVAYAADRRAQGLWVAPVTTITNFADARDQLRVSSVHVGATTLLTVRNMGQTGVNDATLTLPRAPAQVEWMGGTGTRDINHAQIRVGNIAPGETVSIAVRYS